MLQKSQIVMATLQSIFKPVYDPLYCPKTAKVRTVISQAVGKWEGLLQLAYCKNPFMKSEGSLIGCAIRQVAPFERLQQNYMYMVLMKS